MLKENICIAGVRVLIQKSCFNNHFFCKKASMWLIIELLIETEIINLARAAVADQHRSRRANESKRV